MRHSQAKNSGSAVSSHDLLLPGTQSQTKNFMTWIVWQGIWVLKASGSCVLACFWDVTDAQDWLLLGATETKLPSIQNKSWCNTWLPERGKKYPNCWLQTKEIVSNRFSKKYWSKALFTKLQIKPRVVPFPGRMLYTLNLLQCRLFGSFSIQFRSLSFQSGGFLSPVWCQQCYLQHWWMTVP